jgi:hypothetical protein
MKSAYNPLVEDYTEIFYMTREGDAPSVQYEMNFRWSKSIREIEGPSFILINFNIPALAPGIN